MADNSLTSHTFVPKFDGFYDHWAMLMENLLQSKELWSSIDPGMTVAPENATAAQLEEARLSKLQDLKVKSYLFQAIDRTILETILTRNTSKEIWEAMKRKYQGSTKVKRAQLQALRRDFEVLAMKDDETVDEYFSRTLAIANKMTAHGERMEQVTVVEKILRSMTEKFNYVVCSIEESNDVTSLSIDELQSSLMIHEQRMKSYQHHSDEQALKVTNSGRGGNSSRGRGRSNPKGRGRGKQSRETVECFKCHKLGHYRNECPEWEDNANFAELEDEEETLLMARIDQNSVTKEESWYLDSGCSNHMVGNQDWFFDFDSTYRDSVRLGNDARMPVMGKGNVKLLINGKSHVITNVYYLPGLNTNLLSVGQLQEGTNVGLLFKNNACKVYLDDKGLILSTSMSHNRMFVFTASVILPMCLQVTNQEITQLWHYRYGHLSLKGLKLLKKLNMVKGLPEIENVEDKCTDCLTGKQHRQAIPKQAKWRASAKLELIHSDLCGPINPTSNGGKRYFMTLTDDFSRKTWIYVLKDKSETLEKFKCFKALVENESGCKIQCLRTDRGGEYTSNAFNSFCTTHGIKRQLTTAYTPQQNGVSERKNRTLLNMVRSMLTSRNVPKNFWPEALVWSTHILNRSPTVSVKNMTPEECWSGFKPSIAHFRVFGCIAHVHTPENLRKKLDDRSSICVNLGLSDESKGYKLYNPTTKKIVVSKDVIFEEGKSWKWDNQQRSTGNNEIVIEEKIPTITHPHVDENDIADIDMDNHSQSTEANDELDNDGQANDEQHESNSEPEIDTEVLGVRQRKLPAHLKDFVVGEQAQGEFLDEFINQFQNFVFYSNNEDPDTYEEASKSQVWREAMNAEIMAIEENQTWELTDLPAGAKPIGVKWIFKTKFNESGQIDKCKARLVAKGYSQKYGIDYNEVFAPVARWETIRSVLACAASNNWFVYQLDVKSAFLHGELSEDIYVEQPLGYHKGDSRKVYKLKKALYGLKQAPRAWYSKIESYFDSKGFQKCPAEHTLFVKVEDRDILIVSVYVDDLIVTGSNEGKIKDFKQSMMKQFAMTDLGKMKYFLGVEVSQTEDGIFIHQSKYASEILDKFGMTNCNSVNNPIVPGSKLVKDENGKAGDAKNYKQIVGSLMYLLATRPDLAFSVCLCARYMDRPTEIHFAAVKRILRYLKGTTGYGIMYKRSARLKLNGWTDSDYAGDLDDRKSTSGYVFMLGNAAVSWSSKKQPIVTLSTTEAEFVAAAACACQSLWLKNVLSHLQVMNDEKILIHCDNSSSIKLSKNPILHGRCKHIDVRFHFLRDLAKDDVIELVHCKSQDQIADIMTKPLKFETFSKIRSNLGMIDAICIN
jgi:transposase InsO family protein